MSLNSYPAGIIIINGTTTFSFSCIWCEDGVSFLPGGVILVPIEPNGFIVVRAGGFGVLEPETLDSVSVFLLPGATNTLCFSFLEEDSLVVTRDGGSVEAGSDELLSTMFSWIGGGVPVACCN